MTTNPEKIWVPEKPSLPYGGEDASHEEKQKAYSDYRTAWHETVVRPYLADEDMKTGRPR